jgi:hypothetical protein
MMRRFVRNQDFSALSLRDLLDARDHYSVHLANLPNVTGTAVGRYRVRLNDSRDQKAMKEAAPIALGPRTLENSETKSWSWPCVLVFVSTWEDPTLFVKHPEFAVPKFLYLPDGRLVRTCVIYAPIREKNLQSEPLLLNPSGLWGAGSQLHLENQGITRLGVSTCLVTDGTLTYVLTSGHIVGAPGGEVFAFKGGKRVAVGQSTKRVNTASLSDLYPGFSGKRTQVTLDAGLVEIKSVYDWTSQALGVGVLGVPIEVSSDTMSLDLINCPVFAELPSGLRVEGSIQALFFRHASVGGVDSVCEFVIGPRRRGEQINVRPGDSGVLWFWDHVADLNTDAIQHPAVTSQPQFRPLAAQWGGRGFNGFPDTQSVEFALATSISSICKSLDVEVIRDWSAFQSRYWGKVGHYKIGNAACSLLQSTKAKKLFEANIDRISVSDEDMNQGLLPGQKDEDTFIALADVADLYWRKVRKKDDANHFADMDERSEIAPFIGMSLMDLWQNDPTSRNPTLWTKFYDSLDPKMPNKGRGSLPFRVKQLYDLMVSSVASKKLAEYICAAGLLAHYIGDACQPLHVSHLHHGFKDDPDDDKVHAVYETQMLDRFRVNVVAGINELAIPVLKKDLFKGAENAADAVVQLMKNTVDTLPPEDVIASFNRHKGNQQTKMMWLDLGEPTLQLMAEGANTLARIWQSAWTEGGGDKLNHIDHAKLKPISKPALKKLYENKSFAESSWLRDM